MTHRLRPMHSIGSLTKQPLANAREESFCAVIHCAIDRLREQVHGTHTKPFHNLANTHQQPFTDMLWFITRCSGLLSDCLLVE